MSRARLAVVLLSCLTGATACERTPSDLVGPLSPRTSSFADAARTLTFNENFTLKNGAVPEKLEVTGAGTPEYSGGVAVFNVFRTYLRTIENYSATNFKADVTVSVVQPSNPNGIAFIGFGLGEPKLDFFEEPSTYPSVYARLLPDGFHGGGIDVTDYTGMGYTNFIAGQGGTGTHRIRISWNAATREVTFGIHSDYVDGAEFNPTTVYGPAVVGEGIDAGNSHIFIGGADGATFDNLRVVVTPSR